MSARRTSLEGVPLFEGLAGAELDALAARLRERWVEAGTEVIRQGDQGTELLVITAGSLEIRIDGRPVPPERALPHGEPIPIEYG